VIPPAGCIAGVSAEFVCGYPSEEPTLVAHVLGVQEGAFTERGGIGDPDAADPVAIGGGCGFEVFKEGLIEFLWGEAQRQDGAYDMRTSFTLMKPIPPAKMMVTSPS